MQTGPNPDPTSTEALKGRGFAAGSLSQNVDTHTQEQAISQDGASMERKRMDVRVACGVCEGGHVEERVEGRMEGWEWGPGWDGRCAEARGEAAAKRWSHPTDSESVAPQAVKP
eukprot:41621-Chlamydomonas_euryale.AAC.1